MIILLEVIIPRERVGERGHFRRLSSLLRSREAGRTLETSAMNLDWMKGSSFTRASASAPYSLCATIQEQDSGRESAM